MAALLVAAATSPAAAAPPPGHAAGGACDLAVTPASSWQAELPFEIDDGRIFVQVLVDGRGPFRFAVDTGASGDARADASLVAELDLPITGEQANSDGIRTAQAATTRLDMLELGPLAKRGLEVITRDYASRKPPASRFHGILGRGFFDGVLLMIDYPRRRLRFSSTLGLSATDAGAMAYTRAFRVPARIGTVDTIGNIDTGANVSFVLPSALHERLGGSTPVAAGKGRLANGEIEAGRVTVAGPFRVGALELADVEVRVAAGFPELLIGAHALQNAVLLIDQRANALAVCRPPP